MEAYGLENVSPAEMVVFAVLAGAAVAGALFTITRRNPVAAVMSLVATFFALAGIYATLTPTSWRCCRCWSTPAPSWCCSSSWS